MQKAIYRNGSGSTRQRAIEKLEQQLNKLLGDNGKQNSEPQNGFARFLQPLIDRRKN